MEFRRARSAGAVKQAAENRKKLSIVAALLILALGVATAPAAEVGAGAAGAAIVGTIGDALGHPLERVRLELRSETGRTVERSTTDGGGRFEFVRLAPGNYTIVARKRGFKRSVEVARFRQHIRPQSRLRWRLNRN
jgi:hypothetical protein